MADSSALSADAAAFDSEVLAADAEPAALDAEFAALVSEVLAANAELAAFVAELAVQDVIDSMNEEQKTVLYALVGQALEENENDEGDNKEMKHNVFSDSDENYTGDTISHAEIAAAITDAKRYGSMKDSFIQHGISDNSLTGTSLNGSLKN